MGTDSAGIRKRSGGGRPDPDVAAAGSWSVSGLADPVRELVVMHDNSQQI